MKFAKWTKPGTNEVRVYINDHSLGFDKKPFIVALPGQAEWTVKCFGLYPTELDNFMNEVEDELAALNGGERVLEFSQVLALCLNPPSTPPLKPLLPLEKIMSEITNFERAAYYAIEDRELEDKDDSLFTEAVVETFEPVDNFRPVDIMSKKKAGTEYQTPWGPVVVRRKIQRAKGMRRETMYLYRDEERGVTLIGWGN